MRSTTTISAWEKGSTEVMPTARKPSSRAYDFTSLVRDTAYPEKDRVAVWPPYAYFCGLNLLPCERALAALELVIGPANTKLLQLLLGGNARISPGAEVVV